MVKSITLVAPKLVLGLCSPLAAEPWKSLLVAGKLGTELPDGKGERALSPGHLLPCGESCVPVLCLLLHSHPSALLRVTLGVVAARKAKGKEGGDGREKGLRERESHGHGCPESRSAAVQVKTWRKRQGRGSG